MFHDEVEDSFILEKVQKRNHTTMPDHSQDIGLEGNESLGSFWLTIGKLGPSSCLHPAMRGNL